MNAAFKLPMQCMSSYRVKLPYMAMQMLPNALGTMNPMNIRGFLFQTNGYTPWQYGIIQHCEFWYLLLLLVNFAIVKNLVLFTASFHLIKTKYYVECVLVYPSRLFCCTTSTCAWIIVYCCNGCLIIILVYFVT